MITEHLGVLHVAPGGTMQLRTLGRLSVVTGLALTVLTVAASPAGAATSWTGSRNCGTSYVALSFSAATGTYDVNKVAFEHVDYGTSSYTVHNNYEVEPVYVGYTVRTLMHSINWSIYMIGAAQTKTPTSSCIPAPQKYNTMVTRSGSKNCGSQRVMITPNAYSWELDVSFSGSGPGSSGSRAYYPVSGIRYAFETLTGLSYVDYTVTARGVMPGIGSDPQINILGLECY